MLLTCYVTFHGMPHVICLFSKSSVSTSYKILWDVSPTLLVFTGGRRQVWGHVGVDSNTPRMLAEHLRRRAATVLMWLS